MEQTQPALLSGKGGEWLINMLFCPGNRLGLDIPKIIIKRNQHLPLIDLLGSGRFGTVFSTELSLPLANKCGGKPIVKIFHNIADAKREEEALRLISHRSELQHRMTQLVYTNYDEKAKTYALVLYPEAVPFAPTRRQRLFSPSSSKLLSASIAAVEPTSQHFAELVDTLRILHQDVGGYYLIHRESVPINVFARPEVPPYHVPPYHIIIQFSFLSLPSLSSFSLL